MTYKGPVLLFDGVCNLCNRLVMFVIKIDRTKKIMFAPFQAETKYIASLLDNYGLDVKDMDTVIYVSENNVYLKSSAILHLLKDIGGLWRLSYAFIIIPVIIRDFIYNKIARNRYKIFGSRESCMVPSTEIKHRFV